MTADTNPARPELLIGDADANDLAGTGRNEIIDAGAGDDIVNGGGGADFAYGGDGNDVFVFGRGSGHDRVISRDADGIYYDIVQFGPGIAPEQVTFTRVGNDLIVTLAGSPDDSLTVAAFFPDDPDGWPQAIDEFWFADGYFIDVATLLSMPIAVRDADRTVRGGAGDDALTGGSGDDTLYGNAGDDTLHGGDGHDTLIGGRGNDVLSGGAGNDSLIGGDGDDVFRFGRGSGIDAVENIQDGKAGNDTVELEAGIAPGDIELQRTNNGDLVIRIVGSDDMLLVTDFFWFERGEGVRQIRFADGTVWNTADIWTRAQATIDRPLPEQNPLMDWTWYTGPLRPGYAGNDNLSDSAFDEIALKGAFGGSGNDTLFGRDSLQDGGSGDDEYQIGGGVNWYRFGRESGRDQLTWYDMTDAMRDQHSAIFIEENLAPQDLIVERIGLGVQLRVLGADATFRLIDVLNEDGTLAMDARNFPIREVRFADGTVWDLAQLAAGLHSDVPVTLQADPLRADLSGGGGADTLTGDANDNRLYGLGGDDILSGGDGYDQLHGGSGADTLLGGAGNDELQGGAGADLLDGGSGDDRLNGGTGVDTYRFGAGSGRDLIEEDTPRLGYDANVSELTVIDIGAGIGVGDLSYRGDGLSLGGADRVDFSTGLDLLEIRFDDGTIYSRQELRAFAAAAQAGATALLGTAAGDALTGTAAADLIVGGAGDDIIEGGAGDDLLAGSNGSDTYRFGRGDGQDTIYNFDRVDGVDETDTIEFAAGVAAGDIEISSVGQDLVLRIKDTGDSIRIAGFLNADAATRGYDQTIDRVRFADGTVWTPEQLRSMLYAPSDAAQNMTGSDGADLLDGGGGNDYLFGGGGDDILIGGAGDDYMDGGSGANIYRFEAGFGIDVVHSWGMDAETFEFGPGIGPDDLRFNSGAYSFTVSVAGTGDRVTLSGPYNFADFPARAFKFADGTVWDSQEIQRRAMQGTEASQTIFGTRLADVIDGAGGDDDIYGNEGDDRLSGGAGNDILRAGSGSDVLDGGAGNDRYLFESNNGQDVVWNRRLSADGAQFDVIELPSDVYSVSRGGLRDLVLTHSQGTLTLRDYFVEHADGSVDYRIDELRFADGSVWNRADLEGRIDAAQRVARYVIGGDGADTIVGSAAADQLFGGAGADSVDGGVGDDLIVGGAGDDTLSGGAGDDVYRFDTSLGAQGADSIAEAGEGGGNDAIAFDPGTVVGTLSYLREGDSLKLVAASGDSIVVTDHFLAADGEGARIEEIRYADGTVHGRQDLRAGVHASALGLSVGYGGTGADVLTGGAAADALNGGNGDDALSGGTGDDLLVGGAGSDIYRFALGDGRDTIYNHRRAGSGDVDAIEFAAGIAAADVSVGGDARDLILAIGAGTDAIVLSDFLGADLDADGYDHRVQEVRFADGTVWTAADLLARFQAGTAADQTLYGSAGADSIDGGAGNDLLLGQRGTDLLRGGEGDDTLDGGAGDDRLEGGAGNDVYRFAPGGGHDTIAQQRRSGGEFDAIALAAGIAPAGVSVSRPNPADLVLTVTATGETLTIAGYFASYADDSGANRRTDEVRFADGTVWGRSELESRLSPAELEGWYRIGGDDYDYLYGGNAADRLEGGDGGDYLDGNGGNDLLDGGAGADRLYGGSGDNVLLGGDGNDELSSEEGNDRLVGGAGDDSLSSGGGSDTYVFDLGWGRDTLVDWDDQPAWVDRIEFGVGIDAASIQASRLNDDLILTRGSDRVRVQGHFRADDGAVVEEVRFADGTLWDAAKLAQLTSPPENPWGDASARGLIQAMAGESGGGAALTGGFQEPWRLQQLF